MSLANVSHKGNSHASLLAPCHAMGALLIGAWQLMRRPLPQRRACESFEVAFGRHRLHVTAGYYADGTLGEVFITALKSGSELEALGRDGAILLSLAIQERIPLDLICNAVTRDSDGAPSSLIGAVADKLKLC